MFTWFYFSIRPDQFNFLCHGSGGYKFLTNRKRKEKGRVSNLWKLANPLPNRHLLAENMAVCNFAWLPLVVKRDSATIFPINTGWDTNFGKLFEIIIDIPLYPVLLPYKNNILVNQSRGQRLSRPEIFFFYPAGSICRQKKSVAQKI